MEKIMIDDEEIEVEEQDEKPTSLFKINFKPKFKQKAVISNGIISDALKLQAGDYICKYGDYNTIHLVTEVSKENLSDPEVKQYISKFKTNYQVNQDALDVLENYIKNDNFGICRIHYRCIMRNGKQIPKGKNMSRREFDWMGCNKSYNQYSKVTIEDAVRQVENQNLQFKNYISRTEKDIQANEDKIQFLKGL